MSGEDVQPISVANFKISIVLLGSKSNQNYQFVNHDQEVLLSVSSLF